MRVRVALSSRSVGTPPVLKSLNSLMRLNGLHQIAEDFARRRDAPVAERHLCVRCALARFHRAGLDAELQAAVVEVERAIQAGLRDVGFLFLEVDAQVLAPTADSEGEVRVAAQAERRW